MGCGCQGGMFTPANVHRATSAPPAERAKNRMTALVGGAGQSRRWSGPLRPVKQPKAE